MEQKLKCRYFQHISVQICYCKKQKASRPFAFYMHDMLLTDMIYKQR